MIDFSQFLFMRQEISLLVVWLFLIIYDIVAGQKGSKAFQWVACILVALQTLFGCFYSVEGEAFSGMFQSTGITILMKNIMSVATLVVILQAVPWLKEKGVKTYQAEFYSILLATLLGAYFMVSSGHFLLLYIGIEMMSLPLACLIAYNKSKAESVEAGAKYILVTAFSSAIMLFGLSYIYGSNGSMYFSDIASTLSLSAVSILGLVFFFAGLAFKMSLVPFHLWAADVYQGAPTPVTAYLSIVSKAAAAFTLMFVLWRVFAGMEQIWYYIIWTITVVTITIGNLFAMRQGNIKRFLAFSSISQAGYILLGIIGGTAQGMTATVYYVLVYLFSNLAAFGVIAAVEHVSGKTDIDAYNGLYKRNPKLAFVMMLAVFSLAGIPPFAGFFSKFFIFAAAASKGEYLLVFIALVNTVISLYYYLKIVKAMFISPEDEHSVPAFKTAASNRLSLLFCTAGTILIGLLSCIYSYIDTFSVGL